MRIIHECRKDRCKTAFKAGSRKCQKCFMAIHVCKGIARGDLQYTVEHSAAFGFVCWQWMRPYRNIVDPSAPGFEFLKPVKDEMWKQLNDEKWV